MSVHECASVCMQAGRQADVPQRGCRLFLLFPALNKMLRAVTAKGERGGGGGAEEEGALLQFERSGWVEAVFSVKSNRPLKTLLEV